MTASSRRHWYVAVPRSPLVFRRGLPFGAWDGGGGADGLTSPRPSTVAGAVRAAWADATHHFDEDRSPARHQQLRSGLEVAALLATAAANGQIDPLFAVPQDALLTEQPDGSRVYVRLRPCPPDPAVGGCDLPHGLWPVEEPSDTEDSVVADDGAACWGSIGMWNWLAGGVDAPREAACEPRRGFSPDVRTHAPVDHARRKGMDHALHQSMRLDGQPAGWDRPHDRGADHDQVVLAVSVIGRHDTLDAARIDGVVRRLGADGPSARYRRINEGDGSSTQAATGQELAAHPLSWVGSGPGAMPDALAQALAALKSGDMVRLVLATPALFAAGWYPAFLKEQPDGCLAGNLGPHIGVTLRGVALERWDAVVSRPMLNDPRVRPDGATAIRRLVPAGAVYWLELHGDAPGAEVWKQLWMRPVADDEQDRLDGWGLSLLGPA